MKKNNFLFVTGILLIIGGSISIIFGIIAVLAVSALAVALGVGSGLLTVSAILTLVSAIVSFIAGILGVANAAKPEKAMVCIVFGVLAAALAVFGSILNVIGGNTFNFVSLIFGLALPVLYLIGAFQSKKMMG